MSDGRRFEIVCEIEPATKPDLTRVRHQIGVLAPVATAFLIPDNHLGRATVSSVACAHEVQAMGGRSIACVNSRDRNLLGYQRDLLTAAAYGVDHFLLLHGDRPTSGERTSQLTVRTMMDEARAVSSQAAFSDSPPFRVGVTARPGRPLVGWKRDADFLFAQVGFSAEAFVEWRHGLDFTGPVYAGVMVVASVAMARRLQAAGTDLVIPESVVEGLEHDPDHGIDVACELVRELADSRVLDGVHLVPVGRYRQVAARLESLGF